MGVVSYLLIADLRTRWRSLVVLTALVATVVGAVLMCVAGARRTQSAVDRYVEQVHSLDALVIADSGSITPEQVAHIDGVEAAVGYRWFYLQFDAAGHDDFFPTFVPDDDRVPTTYLRSPVLAGRLPDPDEPLDIALGERTARRLRVRVGDDLPAQTMTPQQAANIDDVDLDALAGPHLTFKVVGIVRDLCPPGRRPGPGCNRATDRVKAPHGPALRGFDGRTAGEFGSLQEQPADIERR